ncbi:MAG: hypothetical protein AAGF11_35635 [Myxococcota bacterium]
MSEGSDTTASSDGSGSTRGSGDGLASTGTGVLDGSGGTSDGDGRTDSDTSTGALPDTDTDTETDTDTDTGAGTDVCAPVQPPQLLMDFGDIRLYLYEEVVSRQTFSQSAVDTPLQQQYIEFLEQVDADWPSVDVFDQLALLAHQRDVFVDAGIDDGALWDALIDGSIGEVTSVICLHSIFFDLQNQDFPVWNASTELAAAVLTQEIDGQTHIRAYIQTQDGILGVFDNSFIDAAEDDLAAGWDMLAHFHSHPFAPDNQFGDVAGTVIPSDPDIATFQSLSATHDLREAWISNGIHSLRLLDEEFNAL